MNKYDQIKTLGQGGFGKAILAKRKSDNVQVVIKEVRLTALGPKDREEALKEVKVLASLKHPYIVEYNESFQERGCLYIVMGFADGGDLAQKIEKQRGKPFSEEQVLHDFIEIALAIKYIHDRKILHRDLKGQNVFLMKDGTVKLGDFGIAKVLQHTFQVCRTQIGTPYYLSPEICQGRNYNAKTDIWSLGCILYELCTLKHAFEAGNMNQLLMNIVRGRFSPIPNTFSQDLRNLVDKMLTKEPEKRPSINQVLSTPFIKDKLSKYLDQTLLDYEMQHTVIHGRKPFAEPTMVAHKPDAGGGGDDFADYPPIDIAPPSPPRGGGGGGGAPPSPARGGGMSPEEEKRREEQRKKLLEMEAKQREYDKKLRGAAENLNKRKQELERQEQVKMRELEKREQDYKNREQAKLRELEKREQAIRAKENELQQRERAKLDAAQREKLDAERREQMRRQQELEDKKRRMEQEREDQAKQIRQKEYEDRMRAAQAARNRDRGGIEFGGGGGGGGAQRRNDNAGGGAAGCFNYGGDDTPPRRQNKVDRMAAEDAARRRVYEEQRAAAAANRERQRRDAMDGGGARDAICGGYANDDEPPRNRRQDKQRQQEREEEERRAIFMEQRRAAMANRDRQRNEYMDGGDARDAICGGHYANDRDDEKPMRREDKRKQQEREDEERRAIFAEQRRAAAANRERQRQEYMDGGGARDAMCGGYADDDDDKPVRREDKKKQQEREDEERKAIFAEQRRAALANRNRQRQEYMDGGGARDAMCGGYEDDDADAKPQKKKQQSPEELNEYMRQLRHERAANKAKAMQVEHKRSYEDDPEPEPDPEPKPQKKKQQSPEELNEYMRQLRHERQANKAKAMQVEQQRSVQDDSDSDPPPKPQKKQQKDMSPEELNAYMRELRHERQANKAKAMQVEQQRSVQDSDSDSDPPPKPQKKQQKDMSPEELNAYMRELRHERQANKAKAMQVEQQRSVQDDDSDSDPPPPKKEKKKEMSPEELNAYMRELRHERRANKAKAMQVEQQRSVQDEDSDSDPPPQKQEKKKEMSPEELNAYMRELRHERRANKAKAMQIEQQRSVQDEDSDSDPPPQKQEKKKEMSPEELNAYMRELRHERRANKAKAMQVEQQRSVQDDESDSDPPPPKQEKKKEMSPEELNAYMRELRHERRANKAKAMQVEQQRSVQDEPDSDPDPAPKQRKKQEDMSPEELNAYMRELRHERQANRNKALGADQNQPADPPSDDEDEPPPQKPAKKEMNLQEINAFMREQRHARRANKARAEAELQGINMDDLVAQAEAEQRANPPPPEPAKADSPATNKKQKAQEDMTPEELNEYMRQLRHERQANKNRALGAANEAPVNDESDDDPPPPPKKPKKEMSLEEINAFMREQRHARRANKARAEAELQGINMDDLVAQAEAEQRANPKAAEPEKKGAPPQEDDEPPPQKPAKKEMSLEEINAFMREQRHARRANKAKAEAEQQGIDMDQLIAQAEAEVKANPPKQQPDPVPASPKRAEPAELPKPERPSSQQRQASEPAKPQGRMSVVEAMKQARNKKNQEPPSSSRSNDNLLNQDELKKLFNQQRNELRLNRERIKAAQDGSRDPSIAEKLDPIKQPQSARRPPPAAPAANLKNSNRRLLKVESEPEDYVPPENDETPENEAPGTKMDLSQALNSKSAKMFLKSRSTVLDNLQEVNSDDEKQEEQSKNEENESQLDGIALQAKLINDALDIKSEDEQPDDATEETPEPFYLQNKALNFPVVKDSDSLSYRAEAIRAFLERELGLDKLIQLKSDIVNQKGDSPSLLMQNIEPGLIVLTQQLLVLDECIDSVQY